MARSKETCRPLTSRPAPRPNHGTTACGEASSRRAKRPRRRPNNPIPTRSSNRRKAVTEPIAQADIEAIAEQLGRPPRGILEISSRCPSGHPNVVKTEPRLHDGTPFPTLYYITCPRLAGVIGTLEASGLMREMTERVGTDATLAGAYRQAHDAYLAEREAIDHVPEIAGVTAGGCLLYTSPSPRDRTRSRMPS